MFTFSTALENMWYILIITPIRDFSYSLWKYKNTWHRSIYNLYYVYDYVLISFGIIIKLIRRIYLKYLYKTYIMV